MNPTILWGAKGIGYCAYCEKEITDFDDHQEYYNDIDEYAYQGHALCVLNATNKELFVLRKLRKG